MADKVFATGETFAIDFHVHSCYSPDSLLRPEKIIRVARRKGLSGVAVVDHDTVRGGLEAVGLVGESGDFVAIAGAEIRTDVGEVIGLFLKSEIKSREFSEVVAEIRRQDGIVVLPHPCRTFVSVDSIDNKIIGSVDIIEGFNARMKSGLLNTEAQRLARRAGKPVLGGSDAHFAHEIGGGRTIFRDMPLTSDAVRKALLEGGMEVVGRILPLPLYAFYEFGLGRWLRFWKSRRQGGKQ